MRRWQGRWWTGMRCHAGDGSAGGRGEPHRDVDREPLQAQHRTVGCQPPRLGLSLALAALLIALLTGCGGNTQASRQTPTATHQPSVIYVALGASDAVGRGATDPNTQGYVPRLIARLPADADALNLGIDGATVQQALTAELPKALSKHPTLVTVWLAANDLRDCVPLADDPATGAAGYSGELDTLLGALQSATKAQVFVADLPDMSLLPAMQPGPDLGRCFQNATQAQIRARVQQWNAVIAAAVARHGDVLVELFSSDLASHPEYISGDGFHPTSAGYARLADLFWGQIQAHHAVPPA